jgi:uncharacterized damage-inducible protein DinB
MSKTSGPLWQGLSGLPAPMDHPFYTLEYAMPAHLLVTQLRFARSEFVRALDGVPAEDARRRVMPMNSLGWMVGHLANQEHRYWVMLGQQMNLAPELNDRVGYGKPASTPVLEEMWQIWRRVTSAADAYLDTLTAATLQGVLLRDGKPVDENIGTLLLRNTYHYWYHTGEASAIRQLLGHASLPEFVGDMKAVAYHPET